MSRIPFILDTDTAQDDCVAILLGSLDRRAELLGLSLVSGNVNFEQQVKNAKLTLNVAEKLGKIPLYLGCRRPLLQGWESAENVHGDGVGGLKMDFDGLPVEEEHAVDALIRITKCRPKEVSVVCIGPLTNLAVATVKDPNFVSNTKQLIVMGGSNNGRGNITAAAEFNFYVDPEAAKIVFKAGFNITVVPWAPLTLEYGVFSRKQMAEIAAVGTPLAQFFTRICETTMQFDERVGIAGSTHPDSLAVALLLYPELCVKSSPYHVDIEVGSGLTRGYSAMSWGVHGLVPNAAVVEIVHAQQFFQLILTMLSTKTTPQRPMNL